MHGKPDLTFFIFLGGEKITSIKVEYVKTVKRVKKNLNVERVGELGEKLTQRLKNEKR